MHLARLTQPLVRENGVLRPASWDEALQRAAEGISKAVARLREKSPQPLRIEVETANLDQVREDLADHGRELEPVPREARRHRHARRRWLRTSARPPPAPS